MKIYILIQDTEDENAMRDATVLEAFTERGLAQGQQKRYEDGALLDGEAVEGREDEWTGDHDTWTVSYRIEEVELYRAPVSSIESQVFIDTGELPTVKEVR